MSFLINPEALGVDYRIVYYLNDEETLLIGTPRKTLLSL